MQEFKAYLVWCVVSMLLFPLLQFIFRNNLALSEGVPQLLAALIHAVITILGIRNHFRFGILINKSRRAGSLTVMTKLEYFRDMNRLLTICLATFTVSLLILCVDAVTLEKYIHSNK